MDALRYIVMGFGFVLALTGIGLFARKGAKGRNRTGTALVLLVSGVLLALVPFVYHEKFRLPDQTIAKIDARDAPAPNAGKPVQPKSDSASTPGTHGGNAASAAEVSPLHAEIRALVADVLNVKLESIDTSAPLVEQPLGADENGIIEILDQIEKRYGVTVPLDTDHASVDSLARYVDARLRGR